MPELDRCAPSAPSSPSTTSPPSNSATGLDRRAIPQRSQRWAQLLADGLYRAHIRPNHISIASVVVSLAGAIALFCTTAPTLSSAGRITLLLIGAIAMPTRLLLNMLDGMLAVEKGLQSPTGDLYNEVPDRLSDLFFFAGAGYATAGFLTCEPLGVATVDIGVALGWLTAALAILTAYVRSLGAANGVKNYFAGPMPKPLRMWALMVATLLSIAEPSFGWNRGVVLIVALALIALGSLITIIMRLRLISRAMRSRALGAARASSEA